MSAYFAVVCVCAVSAAAEEYLVNPGFEVLDADGNPKGWDVFVMPMDGAEGRLSATAGGGERSIMLHNPQPYPEDPANNWSQVIYGDFAGKTLTATCDIRTQDATEAALWIQCFRSSPLRLLAAASSFDEVPIYGTLDWERASVSVEAPPDTTFVMLRCVIRGTGRAWFDDVSFSDGKLSSEESVEALEPFEPEVREGGGELDEFEAVRRQMQATLDALRESNEALRDQIRTLHEEMEQFRGALSPGDDAVELIEPPRRGGEEPGGRHILVPRSEGG